jgi:flagellar biosynthesis/type III secretory pathway M-ring protein FliF/YscJ
MEQLRRALATIRTQATRLTTSQRLLIGSLAVVALMALFLVTQYAGAPQTVALLGPSATAEEQQRAAAYLQGLGINATLKNGVAVVPVSLQYQALAQLQQGQRLPSDKESLLKHLSQQNWMKPNRQLDQMYNAAVQAELGNIISNFPGVERASVFISSPPASGLGQAYRKPSATVTVHTRAGAALTQDAVDSLADLVAGSTAGLLASEVRVVDSAKGKRYRPRSPDDLSSSSYLEQAMNFEKQVQDKIEQGLRYIDGVIVTVNAQVDLTRTQGTERRVLPKGQGTESLPASESSTESVQAGAAPAAGEPGVMSNVGMSIASSRAAPGPSTSETQTETRIENQFGHRSIATVDPGGRATRINVAVGVPMSWVVQVYRQRRGAAGGAAPASADQPTIEQLAEVWDNPSTDPRQRGEKQRLEELLQPLVDTAAAEGGQSSGRVVVSMIPVLEPAAGAGGGAAKAGLLGGGGLGAIGSLAQGPLVKTVLLGGLAVAALLMMAVMVRRSARPEPLPSAEELAGVPPKLPTESDLVGEAAEGDTAMPGIEIDDDSLRKKKMLEQVSEMIRKNPGDAATVFGRWLATEP